MGKVSCTVCNKRCRGTVLKISNYYFHTLCFKCHKCGKVLDESSFQLRDRCLYCPEDYRIKYSTKCITCGSPVEGEVVTALGRTFHTFCLRCFSCNRTMQPGEKTVAFNGRFYCEKCVPPQLPQENNKETESTLSNANGRNSSPSASPVVKDLPDKPPEKSPSRAKLAKSSSLPRRLGAFLRSTKSRSQTLQPNNPSTQVEEPVSAITSVKHGTQALTVNVGESDLANTNSGVGKKFDLNQSLPHSLYSREEAEHHDLQSMPVECYPSTHSTSDTAAVPYSLDAALTTPSMINTFSGDTPTLLFGSVRRICPPGVDYGHQYPVSYLRLAEQGYTAITSSDFVSSLSPLSVATTPGSIHRPPPSTQRLSRRDMPSTYHSQRRTIQASSADPMSQLNGGFCHQRYTSQAFGEVDSTRPEKDRYMRYRQLSPSANLMGRAVSSGRSAGATPNLIGRKSQTYSSYSSPNVNGRRAETMMRSPREGRSMSPEAALSAQAEARRLAAYPGAKIPDADSEPVIDRYDWPAPPSPAVVMIDRRREKAMKSKTLPGAKMGTQSGESDSDTHTCSPCTTHSPSLEKDASSTPVIESNINTLKRATGNSGMFTAVAQYVEEEEKRHRNSSLELDPVSASRSPNASYEPSYSTRYGNHRFASPSRCTLRPDELKRGHFYNSPTFPRPGYTSGILSSRPVSLPRGVNGTHTTAPHWSSTLSAAQRRIYTYNNACRTLPANGTPGTQGDSMTTSGLSIERLAATTELQLAQHNLPPSTQSSYQINSTILTGGGASSDLYRRHPMTNGFNATPTASGDVRANAGDSLKARIDDDFLDVQSWLRPAKTQRNQESKVYSYDQLKVSSNTKLKGIDGRHREDYLSGEEFERIFKMSRKAFQYLPEWKKNDLKQCLDLY